MHTYKDHIARRCSRFLFLHLTLRTVRTHLPNHNLCIPTFSVHLLKCLISLPAIAASDSWGRQRFLKMKLNNLSKQSYIYRPTWLLLIKDLPFPTSSFLIGNWFDVSDEIGAAVACLLTSPSYDFITSWAQTANGDTSINQLHSGTRYPGASTIILDVIPGIPYLTAITMGKLYWNGRAITDGLQWNATIYRYATT